MGLLDKAKGLLKANKSKVDAGLDKAADVAGKKLGGDKADKLNAGVAKAKDALNKID